MKFILVLLVFFLWQCKLSKYESSVTSIRAGDDALKVSANYIGDKNCRKQHKDQSVAEGVIFDNNGRVSNLKSHLLSGKNGELVSVEFKNLRKRQGLMFSGDRFLKKTRNSSLFMRNIKDNCRRLVLSVDSDLPPTIDFHKGFALKKQWEEFAEIALPEFGKLTCLTDRPFCTFSKINRGKRYFALIWPDQNTREVSATVNWIENGKQSATISIVNLTYEGNAPTAWSLPVAGSGKGAQDTGTLAVSYKFNRNFKRDMLTPRQSKVGNTACTISTARQSEKTHILTGAVVVTSNPSAVRNVTSDPSDMNDVSANLPAYILSEKTLHFTSYAGISYDLSCSTFFNYYDKKTDSINHRKDKNLRNIKPGQQVCIEFVNSLDLSIRYPKNKEACAKDTPVIFYF